MKYIKLFEGMNEPQAGDYVICTTKDLTAVWNGLKDFLESTIGRCLHNGINMIEIEYDSVPKEVLYSNFDSTSGKIFRSVMKDDILYWSSNKEDLEIHIDTNKYNL